ncbi:MAG: ribonuclease PH [Chloroflexia bacterium]|nr:ribonuclease PH [Chloroflexia bacterium]
MTEGKRRPDGRTPDALRSVEIVPGVAPFAEGSALVRQGRTHVLCTASVDQRVPRWLAGQGRGWITAEYGMLPRATSKRSDREAVLGKQGGRTLEIQRLIGRSLRAVVDLKGLGERQIILDCDVLQADAGTRCAAITGAYVALAIAIDGLVRQGVLKRRPIKSGVAAVGVGIWHGVPILDPAYEEDAAAEVDGNIVMTASGEFVEIQTTAEGRPFSAAALAAMLTLAEGGIRQLLELQAEAIRAAVGSD